MSYLWKCRDLFENRNQLFKTGNSRGSPLQGNFPQGSKPPVSPSLDGFPERRQIFRTHSSDRSAFQEEPHFNWRSFQTPEPSGPGMSRLRTESSSSGSSIEFSGLEMQRNPTTKKLGPNYCTFCKTNGEVKEFYACHTLKTYANGKSVVVCPVLRKLKCKFCGASGDDAHTITHCPEGSVVVPIAKELKRFNSNYQRK